MILDASAAAANCLGEEDAERYVDLLEGAEHLRMSAATYLEAAIVIDARMPGAFDRFANSLHLEVVPVDREQGDLARAAYRQFGRGSGHPAGLNVGDCFSYALAKQSGLPLLFKGNDFPHTDVEVVGLG